MIGFIAGRAGQTALVLMMVSLLVFSLQIAAPIDPARKALTVGGAVDLPDERDVQAKRIELGLDRPAPERYIRWLGDVATLDLGQSFINKKPVTDLIADRIVASATLAGLTIALSTLLALPLAVFSAVRAGTWADAAVRVLALLGASVPAFWLALLAMWLFSVHLQLLPALGSFTPAGIVLPVLVLTARSVGLLARLMRATLLDALNAEYVQTARSKGLRESVVVRRHVVPNAVTPVLTVIGLDFAALFGEAAVVEWVFAWPGIGRMGVDAALAGDLPVVMGFALVVCLVFIVANAIADIAAGLVDPRQRNRAGLT